MITAGIDMGAKYVKAVIMKDGKLLGKGIILSGKNKEESAKAAFDEALKGAGLKAENVEKIAATGVNRGRVPFPHTEYMEVMTAAKGAVWKFPSARTVIDVGAEEGRGVKADASGKMTDYAVNEKCAAGAGSFTEAMSRALEIKVEEMGPMSLQSTKTVAINAQCAVFAESEVVSLIHAKETKADIANAVNTAIAERISSMVKTVGIDKDVALIGGVAKNPGFVKALSHSVGTDVLVPDDPQFISAIGAALLAAEAK